MFALLAAALVITPAPSAPLPQPFGRELALREPPLNGTDVRILFHFLRRAGPCAPPARSDSDVEYDAELAAAVACVQRRWKVDADAHGVFGATTAWRTLDALADDGWVDDGAPAASRGYAFKLLVPVRANRSIESWARLLDGENNELVRLRVRTHGADVDAAGQRIRGRPWPDFHDDGCAAGATAQARTAARVCLPPPPTALITGLPRRGASGSTCSRRSAPRRPG